MATYISNGSGNWTTIPWLTAATGTFTPTAPAAGSPPSFGYDKIVIRQGHTVTYNTVGVFGDGDDGAIINVPTITNASIILSGGTLRASRTQNTALTALGVIWVAGGAAATANSFLDWGTINDPIPSPFTASISLSCSSLGSAVINVQSSTAAFPNSACFCGSEKTRNTFLTLPANAGPGQAVINVDSCTNWANNDLIIIESDTTSTTRCLSARISNISGNTITLDTNLNFARLAGTRVGNFTSNVTVKSLESSLLAAGVYLAGGTNAIYQFSNASFENFNTSWLRNDPGGSNNTVQGTIGAIGYVGISNLTQPIFRKIAILQTTYANNNPPFNIAGVPFGETLIDDCALFTSTGTTAVGFSYATNTITRTRNTVVYRSPAAISPNGYRATIENCFLNGEIGVFPSGVNGISTVVNNCRLRSNASAIQFDNSNNIAFNLCNIIYPTANFLTANTLNAFGEYTFSDCTITNPISSYSLATASNRTVSDASINVYNPSNNNTFTSYNFFYHLSANPTLRKNGTTSMMFRLKVPNETFNKTFTLPSIQGVTQKVKGNLRFDTSFGTPPSITFGNSVPTTTFTCPAVPNAWHSFEYDLTPTFTGDLNVIITGTSTLSTGYVYLDGLIIDPFIKDARWYGFQVDKNFYRTIDSSTTLTENQVSAYPYIRNLDFVYDECRYWTTTNPTVSSYIDLVNNLGRTIDFTNKGVLLNSAALSSVSYNANTNLVTLSTFNLSAGNNFNAIQTTGGITINDNSAISNVSLIGSVSATTARDLNGVVVDGTLTYNTNSTLVITYTNCNIRKVENNGSGVITLNRLNTVVTEAGRNVVVLENPTYINPVLNGGWLAIFDNTGTLRYYTNSNNQIILPNGSTGVWSYKVGRYGYKVISGTFSTGTVVDIIPPYATNIDPAILETNASVTSAYGEFRNTQQIYDYFSYYNTTSAGLSYPQFYAYRTTLDISDKNLILNPSASIPFAYNGSTFTIKSLNLQSGFIVKGVETTGSLYLSGSASLSAINIISDKINSASVTSLNSVNAAADIVYNTDSDFVIDYTNCIIDKVENLGSGDIRIRKLNSTIVDGTDTQISDYYPTYLNLSLGLGSIAIYDNSSVRQYFTTTNQTIELPYEAGGLWTYRITKYGQRTIDGNFTVNREVGNTYDITPTYQSDVYVYSTLNSVSAYNTFTTIQSIYDYMSYYKTTTTGINFGDLTNIGSILDIGARSLILNSTASSPFSATTNTIVLSTNSLSAGIGYNVNTIKTTDKIFLSGSSTLAGMAVQGSINQESVLDLYGMLVDGTIRYNLSTPALPKSITYTNCNVNTVVNDGDKLITITRQNSTILNATDPEISSVTPITITIQADSDTYVAIYKPNGTRYYYDSGNKTLLLGGDAVTGNWTYKVAKYAHLLSYGGFPIDTNTSSNTTINPTLIVDSSISESSVGNVIAYTDLNTNRKIYDYLSYYKTTSAGIDYGDIATRSIGAILFNKALTLNNTAASMVSILSNVLILKSSGLNEELTVYSTGDFNLLNGSVISDDVKIRATNIDSELVLLGITSITLYPSFNDSNADTNEGPIITDTIYRFKYGSTVDGVLLSGTQYSRVDVGSILLYSFVLNTGNNILDLGTFGQIQQVLNNQNIINEGVKKASILVPHTQNL